MYNVISIVEIILLMMVFVWIYILYRNDKKNSLKYARIILIVLSMIIVATQIFLNKDGFSKQEQKTVTVSQIDTTVPEIQLKGENTVVLQPKSKYVESGYIAIDDQDGDITDKVEITREKIADRTYEVYYNVKDSAGNKAKTVVRKVIVEESKIQEKKDDEQNSEMEKNDDEESNKSKAGVIYLTFDDGPSLDITPKILDILKDENINATFFILNYSDNKEDLIKRIVNEGHTIGIHGYSHEYKEIYSSDEAYMNNIVRLQNKIRETTGITTKYTRFPGGSSNTISRKYSPGIMTRLTQKMLQEGYKYYDWNVSVEDAGSSKTQEEVYNRYVRELSKTRANIVLMHDFSNNNKTLNALRDMIHYGKENGYTFDNIDDDTPMIIHGVNN